MMDNHGFNLLLVFFQDYPVLFKIHVVDSGVKDCYLPTDVDMPLYTEAIDMYVHVSLKILKHQDTQCFNCNHSES